MRDSYWSNNSYYKYYYYYYIFIFPAYLKHCHIVPTLRVSGFHILCSYQKLTFIFFAGLFTLVIMRSKLYGVGLILKWIFFNKNQKPGQLLGTVRCINVGQVIMTCLQLHTGVPPQTRIVPPGFEGRQTRKPGFVKYPPGLHSLDDSATDAGSDKRYLWLYESQQP